MRPALFLASIAFLVGCGSPPPTTQAAPPPPHTPVAPPPEPVSITQASERMLMDDGELVACTSMSRTFALPPAAVWAPPDLEPVTDPWTQLSRPCAEQFATRPGFGVCETVHAPAPIIASAAAPAGSTVQSAITVRYFDHADDQRMQRCIASGGSWTD